MDNCSARVSDDVIRILTEARMHVITFASHTTQVFQILDFTLFDFPKRCPRYVVPFDDDGVTIECIIKIYRDFRQTVIQPNIWRAFRALGFEFDLS
jgi:hypothetical protein